MKYFFDIIEVGCYVKTLFQKYGLPSMFFSKVLLKLHRMPYLILLWYAEYCGLGKSNLWQKC